MQTPSANEIIIPAVALLRNWQNFSKDTYMGIFEMTGLYEVINE